MSKIGVHHIISLINEYLNSKSVTLFPKPYHIFLLDNNNNILIDRHEYKDKEQTPQLSTLIHSDAFKPGNFQHGDFCLHYTTYEITPDINYKLGLIIKGNQEVADTYLKLLKSILVEHTQKQIKKDAVDKNEQFTFAIINSVNFAVISTDLSGHIKYANDQACRILNIRRRELIKTPIDQLIPNWQSIAKMVSAGNEVQNQETLINNESETLKLNLNSSLIIDNHNHKIGFVISFRSIEKVYQLVNKYTGMHARYSFDDIIGKSKIIRQAIDYAQTISSSPSTILIEGESGTGKEVFAQSIHNASKRKDAAFVAINCGAISEGLIESELFGYDEGAFTGAKKGGHPGKFELANNGTLFLDEIGDMKPDMQVKLLRAIQESSITRIGGKKEIPVDVRIIAATNKNLIQEVEKGNFRMDLYYRISVIPLYIPSLRERKGDLPSLIRYFLNQKSLKLQKDIPHMGYSELQQLLDYNWPGNVRELENYVEQLVNFNGKISLDTFQNQKINDSAQNNTNSVMIDFESSSDFTLKDLEKRHIAICIKKHFGNMTKAAKELGISRNTLYQKTKKYDIDITLDR